MRAAGSGHPRPWSDVNLEVCGNKREHAGEQVMGILQIALGDAKSAPAESRETILSLFLPEQRVAAERVLALAVVLDLDHGHQPPEAEVPRLTAVLDSDLQLRFRCAKTEQPVARERLPGRTPRPG